MRKLTLSATIASVLLAGAGAAQQPADGHVFLTPADVRWIDAPPALPKGATVALLSGDPMKAEPFVVRVKVPAGYRIMPHWHPNDENVTVLSGTFALGMGEKFDAAALKALPAGSYMRMPARMNHFAAAKTAATYQVHGMGPFTMTYLNPADDPSQAPR